MPLSTDSCVGGVLCFTAVVSSSSSFFSDIPLLIANKRSHMLGSECNLRNWVSNLEPLSLVFGGPKA